MTYFEVLKESIFYIKMKVFSIRFLSTPQSSLLPADHPESPAITANGTSSTSLAIATCPQPPRTLKIIKNDSPSHTFPDQPQPLFAFCQAVTATIIKIRGLLAIKLIKSRLSMPKLTKV